MQLTPEQQAEKERQRREDPDRRHFLIDPTPQQQAEWEQAVAEEMAHKEENIRHFRKLREAAQEPTFSGELRRALNAAGQQVFALPEKIGVDWRLLSDFRAGEATLPSDAIDRLIHELKLTVEVHAPAPKETSA